MTLAQIVRRSPHREVSVDLGTVLVGALLTAALSPKRPEIANEWLLIEGGGVPAPTPPPGALPV